MKFILLIFLFISGLCIAQSRNELRLGLCDTLPKNLYSRSNLKSLTIENGQGYCHSPIKILSSDIRNLKSLETLQYSYYSSASKLPAEIKYLQNLKHLTVSDIIPEIGELTSLEMLSITVINAQELEDLKTLSFEKLVNLETLNIRFYGNFTVEQTDGLFQEVAALPNLKHLDLISVNDVIIEQIPASANLESLNIRGLKGELKIDFNEFPNIKTLTVSSASDLTEIPMSLYSLTELRKLSITSASLGSIPEGISNLKHLKHLDLTFNKITSLGADFVELKELETLSFVRNFNLKKLPEDFGKLSNLKRLALQACHLSELPESMMALTNLEALSIPSNDIKVLPSDWSKLTKLVRLDAERNKLETIPASLFKIGSLEYLQLGHNCLEGTIFDNKQLPIGGLTALKVFDVSFNDLLKLPNDIGLLSNLEDLNIYNNNLTELPESIGDLKKLDGLSMSNNQIKKLPKSMKKMHIYEFSLHNNAFENFRSLTNNFPHAKRIWIDEQYRVNRLVRPMIGREVYYR